jgi:hypothetical protein
MTATVFAVGLDTPPVPAVEDMLALKVSNGPDVCGFTGSSRPTTPCPPTRVNILPQKSEGYPGRTAHS